MNSFPFSKFAFIVYVIATTACSTQTHPGTATPTSFTLPTFTSTSTPRTEVITTKNINQLALLKQLTMGRAYGDPIYLPDGKHIIQGTTTGIYNFDITSFPNGERVIPKTEEFKSYYVESVNISPDGEILVAGDALFSVKDGQRLTNLEELSDAEEWKGAYKSNFSPDGSMVAQSYKNINDGDKWRVGIWRISDGSLFHMFDAASGYSTIFSPDSHLMTIEFIEQGKSYIYLYDLQSGTLLRRWPGERSAFLPENRLAIEDEDTIRIFELETGKSKHAFFGKMASFSADGQLIAFLAFDELKVYRIADEQLITTLKGSFEDYDYALLRFSPNGETLAGYMGKSICCGGYTSSLSLWRLSDGTLIKKMDKPSYQFGFSPNGDTLAITYPGSSTQIFRTSEGSLLTNVGGYPYSVNELAFTSDSQQLVVSAAGGNRPNVSFPGDYQTPLLFYEIPSGYLYKYQSEIFKDAPLAFSTDGKIYTPEELTDLPFIHDIEASISSIAFSPDHTKVAIGYTHDLYIWDLSKKTLLLKTTACEKGFISSLAFSPDGLLVARACVEQTNQFFFGTQNVQIWEAIQDGKIARNVISKTNINMVTFSPNGKYLVSGGEYINFWDVSNGDYMFTIDEALFLTPDEDTIGIQRLAFSADSQILAIARRDGTVTLWGVETRQKEYPLFEIQTGSTPVHDVDFSGDGKFLAIGLEDGRVLLYGIK